jgi:peptidoglycan-associated lipoprotein
MRKRLIMNLLLLALFTGCASKKANTIDINDGTSTGNGDEVVDSSQINGYQNVDPYGSENYGNVNYNQNSDYGAVGGGIKNIYFAVDQYVITPEKLPTVINNANILKSAIKTGARVKIEGHCDATGTDEYNYALGLRRAKAAKDAIAIRGVNPSAIKIVSMGESTPECTSSYSESCFAKNRRVEFKITR